jgi:GT2 family glycosyltransferase
MDVTPQQDITAAIINYGGLKDTSELASKLDSQVKKIIVVDNSNDISSGDRLHETAEVITPLKNIGFGKAVNLAASHTDTRWLLILNPDVRLKRNCIKHLLDASVQLHAPLCGPRFYWDDACSLQLPPALGHPLWLLSDRHVSSRDLSDEINLTALAITRHEAFWKEQAPFSEPVLSGACMLVDNHWFQQNKMPIFDEDFFLYYEDTDLCARLMRKGVMPICVAQATAVHYWNQSAEPPESKAELMRASEKIFLDKYYPDGAPALPLTDQINEFTELGDLDTAPALLLPSNTRYLDIGAQNDFIVFARATVEQSSFTFSRTMWRRIRHGSYYFRAIDQDGNPLQFWHWTKSA